MFEITVLGGEVPPVLPELSSTVLQNIQAIYAITTGRNDVFIIAGNEYAYRMLGGGEVILSGAPELAGTVTAFTTLGGNITLDFNWTAADLLNPANNPENCPLSNPIACVVEFNEPVIAVVMVGRNDVLLNVPLDIYEETLNRIVDEFVARGVIPVLTTIPGDPARTDAYNQVIIRVAQESALPIWNLARGIPQEQVNPDLTLTSPGDDQNGMMTPENINNFGTVKRNYLLLQMIRLLRENIPLS